jgi:hypothetical protein
MARVQICVRPLLVVVFSALFPIIANAQPFSEQNVNMVSGTQWPGGDPFLRQQNEPSLAVSTRNPLHLLAGANDYRSVDIPFNAPARPDDEDTGDAWLGVFESRDGGNTWFSTLLDGYPQLTNSTSPLKGFQAGADPVVRAANNGLFYYAGIVLNRGTNPLGGVFVARFIDRNNTEIANPIAYLDTKLIDKGTAGQFIDKPWLAVAPITNGGQCTVDGQTFPARTVYLAYSVFVGNDNNIRTKIIFTQSTDCGATWATPQKLSETYTINQGASVAVDPSNRNNVYVAWRRFKGGTDLDSIILAKSTNAGASFAKGVVVKSITPFEQGTTGASIRTNAYPTMAVDNGGRVHIAWSQRDPISGDGQIVVITSLDGGTSWSLNPNPIDVPPGRGHQFMPSMTFAAGKVTIAWYDLRQDHTIGTYVPTNPFTGFYNEMRTAVGNLAPGPYYAPEVVFWNYLQDVSPTATKLARRHTLDVRVAEANPADVLSFPPPSTRATRYKYGFAQGYTIMQDLQIDPPNLPMFRQGTVPFFGDYIDVAAYVNAPGTARVRHVVWTDNRDVRPPIGKPADWTKYTPVGSINGTSTFDPTQKQPLCDPIATGSRNQNIYTTRITDGMFAGSPGNAKPLGTIQRAFTVFVQNARSTAATYTLSIVPPAAGTASFLQFPPITPQLTVTIPPHSTATRTVFVNAPAGTHVDVNVNEVGGAGLSTVVGLNSDPTTPPNPDIGNSEVFNPDIGNPDIGNPDIGNQGVPTPDIGNPDIGNPDIGNPDIGNPDIGNPDIGNPDIGNPDIGNPDIGNSGIANGSATDTGYDAQNQGNTTGGYTVKLLKNGELPANLLSQLILSKTYDTPTAHGCTPGVEHHRQLIVNINNPTTATVAQLTDPSLLDPNAATMWLAPGEFGRITIRLVDPFHKGLTLDATAYFTPVVIAHSVNTADANGENRRPSISLTILTNSLPDGSVGDAYSAQLQAIGGVGNRTWTATGLPAGLTLSTGGFISGTPTTPGTSSVTVSVTDSATKPHVKSKTFTLQVLGLLITTTSLPDGTLAGLGVVVPDYFTQLNAIGGTGALTWTVAPVLPTRIALNSSSGLLAGPVSQIVDQDYTFSVSDSANPPKSASKVLHLRTAPPVQITTEAVPNATVTQPYSTTINATGGRPPYAWSVKGPSALSIDQNGVLSGLFTQTNSSPVTITVTDAGSPTRVATREYNFSAVFPTIASVTPSTAAAGFGQTVTLNVVDLTTLQNVNVRFSDGSTSAKGFVFAGASNPQNIFVRLPFVGDNNGTTTDLVAGTLTITLLNGQTPLATGNMTLSQSPGSPVLRYLMALSTPAAPENNGCGTLVSTAPIAMIAAGEGIAASAFGIDTVGATLRFSQGLDPVFASSGCSYSSDSIGVAPVFTVPAQIAGGPVNVSISTIVNHSSSAFSTPITLNAVTCYEPAFELFTNSNTDAVGNGGTAPTFSTDGVVCLDHIVDYHWNNGNGATPGTIGLSGVGSWPAIDSVNWTATPPGTVLLNGTYTVTDSNPATWSQNAGSNGVGFTHIWVKSTTPPIQ